MKQLLDLLLFRKFEATLLKNGAFRGQLWCGRQVTTVVIRKKCYKDHHTIFDFTSYSFSSISR